MQTFWQSLLAVLSAPVNNFVAFPSSFHVVFLVLTLAFASAVYAARAKRPLRWRALRRFLLPRRIFLHRSARLDYKYYVLITLLRSGLLGSMVLSSGILTALTTSGLIQLLGPARPLAAPAWVVIGVATLTQVVLFDLGYWIAHRIMHEVPLLWEFHKPHHAAEVLTFATSARSHPIDDLIQTNFIAAALGLGYGLMVYSFGEAAQPLSLLQTNVVFLVYFLTIFHLRHSHIWLPIDGWLGHLIQSPAHHHIHHSAHPRHFGKNLGFCLSFWDWVFGTLYVPSTREKIEFGIGEEAADFRSLSDLLLVPFRKAFGTIARSPTPVATDVEPRV